MRGQANAFCHARGSIAMCCSVSSAFPRMLPMLQHTYGCHSPRVTNGNNGVLGWRFVLVLATLPSQPVGEYAQQEFVPREGFAGEQWVTVLGRAAEQAGTTKKEGFAAFSAGLEEPDFGDELRYRSPDGTVLNFGWNTPFLVDGCCPDLGESGVPVRTPRLVNPAVTLNWGDDHLEAEWNGARLIIDLAEQRRIYAD